ncbi:MAG: ribonuclease P [Candidatus Nanoarchaeia archaeon]|nr:ribonuclease P [Candidatus Nanoarchaeia archaeon]
MHKDNIKKIAEERIALLFRLADNEFEKHPERSKRYVEIARKIGMKAKVSLADHKKKFCRKCGNYLKHGKNTRVRISCSNIVQTCKVCNNISRYKITKHKE